MNKVVASLSKLFYTKNTEDFCIKKSAPPIYLHSLTSEAITVGFECCINVEDVATKILSDKGGSVIEVL